MESQVDKLDYQFLGVYKNAYNPFLPRKQAWAWFTGRLQSPKTVYMTEYFKVQFVFEILVVLGESIGDQPPYHHILLMQ